MEPLDGQARYRNRTIRGAVVTSIMSKMGTLVLRLVSIPVAIHTLGMKQFGVYATILVAVQLVDMFHVGIGPVLTQRLSKANLQQDRGREAALFSTGMLISGSLTLLFASAMALVVWQVPVVALFGEKYAPFADSMQRACLLGLLIISVEMICVVVEKARDGYMETRFTNAWGACGNFLGAALLLLGIDRFPTIEFLILSVNGSIVLAKVANTIHLFVSRPYLFPRFAHFRSTLAAPLMKSAAVFTVVYSLSAVVEYYLIAYLIGRQLGPDATANYSILITIHASLTGMIQMLTIPMWPAVIDAYERGEREWVRRGSTRIRQVAVLFGVAVVVGSATLGPHAIDLWVGDQFSLSRTAIAVFGVYFAFHLWRHVNQVMCLGLSREKPVALVILAESGCVFLAAYLLLGAGHDILSVLAATSACLVLFSGWMFPLIFRNAFRRSEGRTTGTNGSDGEDVPGRTRSEADRAEAGACEMM